MFAVVITEKGGAQRRLDFDKNEVTIGRVQGNDIILPKGNVSKRHSRIVLKDNRFIVVDLKSTNGTYVNGRKITSPLVVKSGDKIYIGDFILTLEEGAGAGGFDAAQASPAPVAAAPPPMPGPPPMSGPPMPHMPAPPPAAPPPVAAPPQRPSAPPPLPPRPAPAPMPAPSPAHMSPAPVSMQAAPPPMPAPAPPMPAPPPMPAHSAPPAPAPMPHHGAPPPAPMPMAGGAAERFPLDEEPAGMDDHAPSPRVVSGAQGAPMPPAPMPMAPPAPQPAPMPPAPMAPAPMAAAPMAPPAPMPAPMAPAPMAPHAPSAPMPQPSTPHAAPPPKGAQASLVAVVAHAAHSFNPYDVPSPAGEGDARRDAARRAVEGAVEAVAKNGMSFDREAIGNAALEELVGLGALGGLIADGSVHEIVVQGPDTIMADRGHGLAPSEAYFSSSEALSVIVGRLVTMSGAYFDRGKAMQEGTLPMGVHFSAILPPIAVGGPIVELRRTQRAGLTGEQLVSRGMLSSEMLEVLRRASRGRKNVVVVGSSDAGVVQLVSAVANLASDGERVLAIEDVPRLELGSSAVVRLTAASGTSLEDIITQGGRMRADRVVIDGVRGKETLAALLTAASRSGSIVGVHSAPSVEAYDHLGALARLGGATSEAITSVLPSAVHVIVRMGRGGDGRPRVESLAEVRRGGNGAQVVELFGHDFASSGQSPSF